MPLIARLDDVGVLDATMPDLGAAGVGWEQLHRVRNPRPPLTCVGCGRGVHAKVSPAPLTLRYFAHDAAASDCALAGESAAHRALKAALAAAVRSAGWHAELEVPGPGWRADVLASAPDGDRRVAWEAQLSGISVDDISARTETLRAGGLEVCWVARRPVAWLGRVPAVQLSPIPAATNVEDRFDVVDGLNRFVRRWCEPATRCAIRGRKRLFPGKCVGHNRWEPVTGMTLERFVGLHCAGQLLQHQPCAGLTPAQERARLRRGPWTWTAEHYVLAEHNRLPDHPETGPAPPRDAPAGDWRAQWRSALHAREERMDALTEPVISYFERTRSVRPHLDPGARRQFADGVPVYIGPDLVAIVEPLGPLVNTLPPGVPIIVGHHYALRRITQTVRDPERTFLILDSSGGELP